MKNIPDHRRVFSPRSGDTCVIGADGASTNVDAEKRSKDQLASEKAAKPAGKVQAGSAKPTNPAA